MKQRTQEKPEQWYHVMIGVSVIVMAMLVLQVLIEHPIIVSALLFLVLAVMVQAFVSYDRLLQRDFDTLVRAHDSIVIDTNVWLNERYAPKLEQLASSAAKAGRPLRMIGPEFEEVVRIKQGGKPPKAARARAALRLVERLQRFGGLVSERMEVQQVQGAYFDRAVLRYAQAQSNAGRSVLLVTDDRELRIRFRGLLGQGGADHAKVTDAREVDLSYPRASTVLRCCVAAPAVLAVNVWHGLGVLRRSMIVCFVGLRRRLRPVWAAVAAALGRCLSRLHAPISVHSPGAGTVSGAGVPRDAAPPPATEIRRCPKCAKLNRLKPWEAGGRQPRCGNCGASI